MFNMLRGAKRLVVQTFQRFVRREDGAALVEFAIVLPLLMLILFSILAWGYSLSLLDAMYSAARQTAREVSVGQISVAQAQSETRADLANWDWNTSDGRSFLVSATEVGVSGGTDVRVVVVASNNFFEALSFVPALPPLRAEVVMRREDL